ncbi:hypothetical protein DDE82_000704 [Stemphylium lycopersici]|uniref:RING-type domain-containing protein n=1 Tax=Stemphylium lycopersici TaxID=183478 RepID=A0A364N9J0_STELY|nr:hypothetical protein DDE82_000704 [Stemphylium lycopersici]RAR13936.1 hypothetical protein DDE83_002666 [Stemphylium lycopersici]
MPALPSVFSHETSSTVSSLKALKRSRIVPLPTAGSDEACCICLNLYGPSHKAVTVLIKDCYHRFGQSCLDAYLDSDSPRSNTCPQCRREWYKRKSVVTTRTGVSAITEALTAASLPQAPVRVESRIRSRRAQRMLEYEHSSSDETIAAHLDEVFRRLDLVQDISNEQTTITADTRVRLQAVERRARRIHQELQTAYYAIAPEISGSASREHEMRQRPDTMSQRDIVSQRGWMEAFTVNLGNDTYSTAIEADRISTTAQDGRAIREEIYPSTRLSSNELEIHPLLRSRPWEGMTENWGVSIQPERYYDIDASLGMFLTASTRASIGRRTDVTSQSEYRASVATLPAVSVAPPSSVVSEVSSNAENVTNSGRLPQEPGNLTGNSAECGLHLLRQSVTGSHAPQQNRTSAPTSDLVWPPRPRENRQVSFTDQPENHLIRTPVFAPPRLPQRRSSLGNLLDCPTPHSAPTANSRPSMSVLERTRSIRDPRQNSASQGRPLHTSPTAPHSDTNKCPICLDAYTTEPCLHITGTAGCNHHIGATCLQEMLKNQPHAEKKCPLCRTTWIPAPVFHPRGQSLGASRRMAEMFHRLDGIGADIAGNPGQASHIPDLHEQTVAGNAGRAGINPSVEIQRATTRPRHGAERTQHPIVIDSSSEGELEEDFTTQVRNFENLTRDIEDIRQRARNSRRGSKRRDKRHSGGREGHHSESGSDHNNSNETRNLRRAAVPSLGTRRGASSGSRPRASTLNRFIKTMRLSPWENPMSETSVRRGGPGSLEAHRRYTGQALPRDSAAATPLRETAPREVSPLTSSSPIQPPLAAPTVAKTIAAFESSRSRVPNRAAHIDRCENWLKFQEQTLRTQQCELERQEAEILERERRVEEAMETVRRHGREIEALVARQKQDLDIMMKGGL